MSGGESGPPLWYGERARQKRHARCGRQGGQGSLLRATASAKTRQQGGSREGRKLNRRLTSRGSGGWQRWTRLRLLVSGDWANVVLSVFGRCEAILPSSGDGSSLMGPCMGGVGHPCREGRVLFRGMDDLLSQPTQVQGPRSSTVGRWRAPGAIVSYLPSSNLHTPQSRHHAVRQYSRRFSRRSDRSH